MRLKRITWSVVAGAATLSVLSVAAAQVPGNLLPILAAANDGATAEISAPRELELPPEQQLALAHDYIARMDTNTTTVRAMLEQARAARDIVKTLCLNDKVNQIDVAVRSSKDRVTTLQGAVAAKDKDRARHEFMILQVLRDRTEELVREANQCIGEEAGFIGESQVTVQVDPGIPDTDPDQLGYDTDVIDQTPVVSSPTM